MSANGPSYWDIAGQIHNLLNSAAPAVEDVEEAVEQAVNATKEVVQEAADELKEVAKDTDFIGETRSASAVVDSIAPTVSNMSTALVSYFPSLSSVIEPIPVSNQIGYQNTTEILTDAPSSYLGYAWGGLALVGGALGLYGISRLLADTKPLVSKEVHDIAKDSKPALQLIQANSKNAAVLALLNNKENMLKLLALEDVNKGTLAGFAKMKASLLLVTLTDALKAKVEQQEELKEVSLNAPTDVLGTQAASSVPVEVASSSSSSTPATAMDMMLAKIAQQHPKASEAYALMNPVSRQGLEKTLNAMNQVKLGTVLGLNDKSLATYLVSCAYACCKQEIKIEGIEAKSKKQTALKM